MKRAAFVAIVVLLGGRAGVVSGQQAPKQALLETTAGTFTIDLTPETAPNQTADFMKLAEAGGYDGTSFHRVVKYGIQKQ